MKIELTPPKGPVISILVAGDLAFPSSSIVPNPVYDKLYSDDILKVLREKDISIVNLECPLTTAGDPISKNGLHFVAHPDTIKALTLADFNIAVLANNHIMDYGQDGMEETISVCERAGIKTVGAGLNLEKACLPLVLEVKNKRIAFLAFTEEEFSCATDTTPGAAKLDLATTGSIVRKVKSASDLVIVNIHGGNEFYHVPSPRMRKWCRFLVECGADAVIGHHTHAVQGIEIYRNIPIIYNLGNFILPKITRKVKTSYLGLLVKLVITGDNVSALELVPVEEIELDNTVRIDILKGVSKKNFEERLKRLSQIASDKKLVNEFWLCFCHDRKNPYLSDLKMITTGLKCEYMGLVKRAIRERNMSYLSCLVPNLINSLCQRKSDEEKLLKLENFISCPAHHEVLKTITEMDIYGQQPSGEIWDEFKHSMYYGDEI